MNSNSYKWMKNFMIIIQGQLLLILVNLFSPSKLSFLILIISI